MVYGAMQDLHDRGTQACFLVQEATPRQALELRPLPRCLGTFRSSDAFLHGSCAYFLLTVSIAQRTPTYYDLYHKSSQKRAPNFMETPLTPLMPLAGPDPQ